MPAARKRRKLTESAISGPGQVYLIVHTPNHAGSVGGQPSTSLSAYLLDVPEGSTSDEIVGQYIADPVNAFPATSCFAVVDASACSPLVLHPTLEPGEMIPGQTDTSTPAPETLSPGLPQS